MTDQGERPVMPVPAQRPQSHAPVLASWVQNLGAGAGVFVAYLAARLLASDLHPVTDWQAQAVAAAGWAGLTFGLLMFVRGAMDEGWFLARMYRWVSVWERDLEALALDLEEAERRAEAAEAEAAAQRKLAQVAQMRASAAELRLTQGSRFTPAAERVEDTWLLEHAYLLLERHVSGAGWARDVVMAESGLTRDEWTEANRLLVAAGVAVGGGKGGYKLREGLSVADARRLIAEHASGASRGNVG